MGAVRVLCQSFPLVLGAAAAPGLHAARLARRLRADRGEGDEREVLLAMLSLEPGLVAARPGQVVIGDKNYYGRDFEKALAEAGLVLLRPARKGEPQRPGSQFFRPLRQVIESVNDTLKGQLDLERHGGRTVDGVTVRVLQRILALTAAIWHNEATGQAVKRSLVAYDH
jgi:hypothetical protein